MHRDAIGHSREADGRSRFRVFAPGKHALHVVLIEQGQRIALAADELGWWSGDCERLPAGTLYQFEVDGRRLPDPASRCQPGGVHGPSMVVDVEPAACHGWRGVAIDDAVIYEIHVGTFTTEGTLAAAQARLPLLQDLGITMVELMPLAEFPGERNWGYDGTCLFALHGAYGDWRDLKAFIEAAHALGIAVLLDVVFNHFGPEGHYAGAFAPYTKAAATPWGAAINFDGAHNHGVRAFFLEAARFWLQDVGFDGLRVDAAALIFDNMPVHILREFTELARRIGQAESREIVMIAEHLRNNRYVTSPQGLGFDAQWNDDLNHALFAWLSGESQRHYVNFGAFDDIVAALDKAFVLDGTRFDKYHHFLLGTDGAATAGREHVVHIQNHDQVGNRLHGDRMIATYGRDKALLAITAVMASPFVPMLFMGEEYGETAPFFFFEDFGDPHVVHGAREGRKAEFAFAGAEPPDPHARATFEASKLQWALRDSVVGQEILAYYRALIALKRSGRLGPRRRADVSVTADAATQIVRLETRTTLTLLNFSAQQQAFAQPAGWVPLLSSVARSPPDVLEPFAARILEPV